MHIQKQFGESLVVYPSILNDLDFGDTAILSITESKSTDSLKIMDDSIQKQVIPSVLSYKIDGMTHEEVNNLLKDFLRTLKNIGLPYDLEQKPLALLTSGDLALAQYVLKGAHDIEDKFPNHSNKNLYLLVGNLHYTLSRVSSGAITISNRDFHLKKAMEFYDKVLSLNQQSVSAWKNKARVMLDLGENEEAIACLIWILDNLNLPPGDLTVLLNLGWAYFKADNYDEAVNYFNSVLDIDPSNVEAWLRKGDVFSKTDRWGGAIQCYTEAVKHAPNREDIWIAMSDTYINHGKYKDASRSLDEVLKINIWSADAWYLQGIVFSRIDRWGAAIQCLDKALNISPLHVRAWKSKGDLLYGTNRYEEAINCYERALKIQPEKTELLLSKARVLKSMGRFKMALGILKRIDVQNKNDPHVLFEIGDILQETGKTYKALKSFDSALEIKPNFIEAFFKKGVTLEKLRRYKEALACYEKVLELNPKYELAQKAMKDIILKMNEK
jgi:tetratricopeptide (TPR) repeat protein